MTTRSSSKTVTFARPFVLDGFPELLPAGDYIVDTEEEELDSILVQGWRRVATAMRVRVGTEVEMRSIDPEALHEALMRDGAQDKPGLPPSQSSAKARFDRARRFTTYPARRKRT
jgi:hypothetical protein